VAQAYAIGETSADPGGIPFRWAVKGLIPLGFGLLALQTVGACCAGAGREAAPGSGRMFEPQTYAILMLVGFFVLLMLGVPVATTLATVGFPVRRIWASATAVQPAAGAHLRRGGRLPVDGHSAVRLHGRDAGEVRLADDLLDVMGHIAGGVRGGMGVGIILFGVLMGATTGIVGATIITLGLLTLPTLIRRGYDKGIACGAICASGTLGQIIPPSLILILLSDIMQLSVGTLFAAAVGRACCWRASTSSSCWCWACSSRTDAAAAPGRA
jgi:TRAP-type mannitol/chloroaromatic compound transport system permease large subunit